MDKTLDKNRKYQSLDQRLIGKVETGSGPTVIFTAGIHGNEPSGVHALRDVLSSLGIFGEILQGNVYAFAGNLSALKEGIRFHERDLNRLWTPERLRLFQDGPVDTGILDIREQYDLYNEIQSILNSGNGPFYFIDLHTTSSKTIPFITINDTMINRKFSLKFPVPVVLGIEEYLHGPLLTYINELGYIAIGFEAGQHDEELAFKNQVAFINLVLKATGILANSDELTDYEEELALQTRGRHDFFEIVDYHHIETGESFKMEPGFENFQPIRKHEFLATSEGKMLYASKKGRIFMPLYQKQGEDGFFIIRKIPDFIIWISGFLRFIRFDSFLTLLPGISWVNEKKDSLRVNLKVARFMARDFLHLLGYRTKERGENYLIVRNRERVARSRDYAGYL